MATNKIEVVISNQAGSGTIPSLTPSHRDLSQYLGAINTNKNLSSTDVQLASAIAKEFAKVFTKFQLNQIAGGGRPNLATELNTLSDRAFKNTGFNTPRVDYDKTSPFNKPSHSFSLPYYNSVADDPSGYFPQYNRGRVSGGILGGNFVMDNTTERLSELANANAEKISIRNQTIAYRNIKTLKGTTIKKRTRVEEAQWQSNLLMVHPNFQGVQGDGFYMRGGSGSRSSDTLRNRLLLGDSSSQPNFIEGQFTEMSAVKQADTIASYLNKIFSKLGVKVDQMIGTAGYRKVDKYGEETKKWVEGTGLAGAYSSPRKLSMMRGAMIGAVTNTAGSLAGNYGNYLMSRANVTGSLAANYYAGTANENLGNYVGGLVNIRSKFLQSQINAGVTGAGQLGVAALLPAIGVEGLLGKIATGVGLGTLAGGLGNLGAAGINQYLEVGGQAFQQKATNLANASVASSFYGLSRFNDNVSTTVLPRNWTMDKTELDLPINKFLATGYTKKDITTGKTVKMDFANEPYYNQLVAYLQNTNVNPMSLNANNVDKDLRMIRKMGFTDTASAAKLGIMSNIYGAINGGMGGALDAMTGQLQKGQDVYGTNYGLDTLLNSVKLASIVPDKDRASALAMQSQYFPEVGAALQTATNSTFAEAITRDALWTAAGFSEKSLTDVLGQRMVDKLDKNGKVMIDKKTGKPIQEMAQIDTSTMVRINRMIKGGAQNVAPEDIVASQLFGHDLTNIARIYNAEHVRKDKTGKLVSDTGVIGDTVGASTFEQVMSTPSMTVNATNVTLNWALENTVGGVAGSLGSTNTMRSNFPILSLGLTVASKLIKDNLTTKSGGQPP